ncbi:MAG: hypothetical protein JHC55_02050, partial [Mycolicibacterium sp.]|nr:hypothetical protein [Mycolicibacterium sp.]
MSIGPRVDPDGLNNIANTLQARAWLSPSTVVAPADGLRETSDAWAENLNENARHLAEYQRLAKSENDRLVESFNTAADAYRRVDEEYAGDIEDPGRAAKAEEVSLPAPERATLPDDMGSLSAPSAGGYQDVEATQQALASGDHGATVEAAIQEWRQQAQFTSVNGALQVSTTDWEGEAADAAFARSNAFSEWLKSLAAAWERLADAGQRVHMAHVAAVATHTNIYTQYMVIKAQIDQLLAQGIPFNDPAITSRQQAMQALQQQSEQ